jgi:hypothetical protein
MGDRTDSNAPRRRGAIVVPVARSPQAQAELDRIVAARPVVEFTVEEWHDIWTGGDPPTEDDVPFSFPTRS